MQLFFRFGIDNDILMNVPKDCIIFFVSEAWVLFVFYLKRKQTFSVRNFTDNANFISLHGGVLS